MTGGIGFKLAVLKGYHPSWTVRRSERGAEPPRPSRGRAKKKKEIKCHLPQTNREHPKTFHHDHWPARMTAAGFLTTSVIRKEGLQPISDLSTTKKPRKLNTTAHPRAMEIRCTKIGGIFPDAEGARLTGPNAGRDLHQKLT